MYATDYYNCTSLILLDNSVIEAISNCSSGSLEATVYEGSSGSDPLNPWTHLAMQIFYGIIFTSGVCGNVLVIYVVSIYSRMQTVTNLYILNLAMADLLYLMGLPFLLITSHIGNWIFGNYMCKFYMVITSLNQFTSSFFLSIMSVDRYIAVCHPISSQKYRTSFISKITSLTAWACSSLMVVPVFMYSTTFQVEENVHCNIYWSTFSFVDGQTLFTLYTLILSFILPVFLIFIFYGLVIKKMQTIQTRVKSMERRKSQRKVTKLVLALIIVYVICYLPYWSLQLLLFFLPPMTAHSSFVLSLFLFSSCLSYSCSALNPILYAFLSDNFKKSFHRICLCTPKVRTIFRLNPKWKCQNGVTRCCTKMKKRTRTRSLDQDSKENCGNQSWDTNFFSYIVRQYSAKSSSRESPYVPTKKNLVKTTRLSPSDESQVQENQQQQQNSTTPSAINEKSLQNYLSTDI